MTRTFQRSFAIVGTLLLPILLAPPADLTAQRSAAPFLWEGTIAEGARVEIKSVNGPVRAVAASGSAVRVRATRTGRRNDPEEVQIVVLEHARGVTVCAVYPAAGGRTNECRPGSEGTLGARNNDVSVSFTVEVPASAVLDVRTTNGAVSSEGVTGVVAARSTNGAVRVEGASSVDVSTTNGNVTIRTGGDATARSTNGSITADLGRLSGNPLSFQTTNGSITLRLPQDANAQIRASTSNGAVQTEIPLTVVGQVRRNQLNGTLGSGGPAIDLRTTNGRIRLERG